MYIKLLFMHIYINNCPAGREPKTKSVATDPSPENSLALNSQIPKAVLLCALTRVSYWVVWDFEPVCIIWDPPRPNSLPFMWCWSARSPPVYCNLRHTVEQGMYWALLLSAHPDTHTSVSWVADPLGDCSVTLLISVAEINWGYSPNRKPMWCKWLRLHSYLGVCLI